MSNEAQCLEGPEAVDDFTDDVQLRDEGPMAGVFARHPIVAQNEIVANWNRHGREIVCSPPGSVKEFLGNLVAVEKELAFSERYPITGNSDDPFDQRFEWRWRVPEHDHVSSLGKPEAIGEAADENPLSIAEQWFHGDALDLERLEAEGREEIKKDRRIGKMADPAKEFSFPGPALRDFHWRSHWLGSRLSGGSKWLLDLRVVGESGFAACSGASPPVELPIFFRSCRSPASSRNSRKARAS